MGMHPQSRQVPPNLSFASTRATFSPYWVERECRRYNLRGRRQEQLRQKSRLPKQSPVFRSPNILDYRSCQAPQGSRNGELFHPDVTEEWGKSNQS